MKSYKVADTLPNIEHGNPAHMCMVKTATYLLISKMNSLLEFFLGRHKGKGYWFKVGDDWHFNGNLMRHRMTWRVNNIRYERRYWLRYNLSEPDHNKLKYLILYSKI